MDDAFAINGSKSPFGTMIKDYSNECCMMEQSNEASPVAMYIFFDNTPW
jgi:hypothetical protein